MPLSKDTSLSDQEPEQSEAENSQTEDEGKRP
jgi:hypothetical protein